MTIIRATSPEVPEPQAGTWSNCLVAGGIAYIAGMTAGGGGETGDEYVQAKAIFSKIRHLVEAAGGSMADVMKVTIFVTDITPARKGVAGAARILYRQLPGLDPGAGRGIGDACAQGRNRSRRPYRRQPQLTRCLLARKGWTASICSQAPVVSRSGKSPQCGLSPTLART